LTENSIPCYFCNQKVQCAIGENQDELVCLRHYRYGDLNYGGLKILE